LRLQRSVVLRQAGSVWLKNRKEEQMSAARFKQVADAARIEKAVSALNAKGFAAQSVPLLRKRRC
jgi:hypothetical protein